MKVGDLVVVLHYKDIFGLRPPAGSIGIIAEIKHSNWLGRYYWVLVDGEFWRFYEDNLEIL